MRKSLVGIILTSVFALPLTAHADPIDDFVLTGGGHTISYSLPATSSFPDFSLFNFFYESAPTTIDGVSGYVVGGAYYYISIAPVSLVYYVPDTVSPTGQLDLQNKSPSPFISWASEPASNPLPYLPYNVVPTFIPGTYTFAGQTNLFQPVYPPIAFTLTITPEVTGTTPEPSSIVLLGTGIFGLIGLALIKRSRAVLTR